MDQESTCSLFAKPFALAWGCASPGEEWSAFSLVHAKATTPHASIPLEVSALVDKKGDELGPCHFVATLVPVGTA